MISVATPSIMPMNENPAMTEMKPSLRRARRYLPASIHSKGEKALVSGTAVLIRMLSGFLGCY